VGEGVGGRGYSQKNLVGVCGPLPKILTLFMTKIYKFSYSIYVQTKNFIPYLFMTVAADPVALNIISLKRFCLWSYR